MFNLNDTKALKVLNEMVFKGYLEEIKAAKPFTIVLFRQHPSSRSLDLNSPFRFLMIGDLARWCSLKPNNCRN